MNKAFLSGRITAEPTVFGGDKKVTRLTLVTERPKLTNGKTTKKDGYTEMETEWHSITVSFGFCYFFLAAEARPFLDEWPKPIFFARSERTAA